MKGMRVAGAFALAASLALGPRTATEAPGGGAVLSGSPPAFHPWPVRATLAARADRCPHNLLGPIPGYCELFVAIRLRADRPVLRCIAHLHPRRSNFPDSRRTAA